MIELKTPKATELLANGNKAVKIVVIGSSCTGKTTVVNLLREIVKEHNLDAAIPRRYITRPRRENDDIVENAHITKEELVELINTDNVEFAWKRPMEAERVEEYAFEKIQGQPKVRIFSGNNAVAYHPDLVFPRNYIDNTTIFLGTYAPEDVRKERFVRRSPDLLELNPQEVAYRLGDTADSIIPYSDIIVHNYGEYENTIRKGLEDMLRHLL